MNIAKWKTSFISAVILVVVAGSAWSADTGTQSSQGMESGRSTGQTGAQGMTERQGVQRNISMTSSLQSKTANDIIGMDVIGEQNKEIGEVDNLVLNKTSKEVQAVIATGEILGLGGKKVVIPLDELQLQDGGLTEKLMSNLTESQLKQRQEFNEKSTEYTEITLKDKPISEFAAFE